MSASLLTLLLSVNSAQPPAPPPMTAEQRERIGKMAADTQREAARLKGLLEQRQRDLTRLYAEYDLDEKAAKSTEADIVDLQQQLLSNYRKMQVELRTLVDKERFAILKKRLDNLLESPDKDAEKNGSRRRPATPSQSESERLIP